MKVEIGVILMIAALMAFTEFTIWRQCSASPSALYCRALSR